MAGHRARSPSEKGIRVKKKKTKTPEQLIESQLPPFLTAMHHNVIALLGYDVADSMWYGVSKDGRAVVKSSSHSSKFIGAALSDWDAAKVKPTTILADMIENDLAITSATLTPRAEHVQTSNIGTKWGGQIALFYFIIEKLPSLLQEYHLPRSSSKSLLTVPTMNSVTYGERAFSFCAPTLWNTLLDSLKNAASLLSFKSALKTFLVTRNII